MTEFRLLKKFCLSEGLHLSKSAKDTNNGELVSMEVRALDSRGGAKIVFSKTKWYPRGVVSREKVLNLLSYECFESLGVPVVNERYWVASEESALRPAMPPVARVNKLAETLRNLPKEGKHSPSPSLDDQIDQILENGPADTGETEGEGTIAETAPPVNNFMDMMGLMGQVQDQSPQGMFAALSTPGGLSQIGSLLKDPQFLNFASPMISMMAGGMFPKPPSGYPKAGEDNEGGERGEEEKDVDNTPEEI